MNTKKILVYLCIISYGAIGLIMSIRTNVFSIVQDAYGLPYSHIATLVLISGLVMQFSTYLTGISIKKWGHKKNLILGLIIFSLCFLLMPFVKSIVLFDLLFTLSMFGFGVCVLTLNMYVGVLAYQSLGKMIMKLHLGYAIGALMGPKILSHFFSKGISWQIVYALCSIPIIFILVALFIINEKNEQTISKENVLGSSIKSYTWKSPIVWTFITIFICGQIWEYGFGTWFAIFAKRAYNYNEATSATFLTIFLICFPIGRIIIGKLIDNIGYYRCLFFAFLLCGIFIICGILFHKLILFSLTGLFACLFYPVNMAMMQQHFGEENAKLIGWISMMGGCIQYFFIWTVGKISDSFGISVGFGSLLIYMFIGAFAVYIAKKQVTMEV